MRINRQILSLGLATLVLTLGAVTLSLMHQDSETADPVYEDARPPVQLPMPIDFDAPRYPDPSIEFDGSLPDVPRQMMVYKVVQPEITEAYVREFGLGHFGIRAHADLQRSPRLGLYRLKTDYLTLEMDPSDGSLSVDVHRAEDLDLAANSGEWPSQEECRRIATEYLKEHRLLPGDAHFLRVVDNTSSGPSWAGMSVAFGRQIDGYNTWGAGARITVEIGRDGNILSLSKQWQNIVPYRPYPIIEPERALKLLQAGKGILMHGDNGEVKRVTLRYYTSPVKQDYIQPVYYFECAGSGGQFYGVVPALRSELTTSQAEILEQHRKGS